MDQLGLIGNNHLLRLTLGHKDQPGPVKGSSGEAVGRGSQPGSVMPWAGNSIGEGSTFSSIGVKMQLHSMGAIGFSKGFGFPKGCNMLPAFVKFSPLTLGVDVKGNTGNLTFGQPMDLHSTGDIALSLLQGRSTKVPPFGKGQGTLSAETGTMDTGLLDTSRWAGTIGWGEW